MPVTAALIGAGVSTINIGTGIHDRVKANRQLKNLGNSPYYENETYGKMVGQAANLASSTRMPGQTGAEARIDQNLANASLGIDRFSNSGSAGISGIVAANANAMQANQGLGIAAAQNYYDRQNAYTNAMGQYAAYRDKQFEQNQLFPWQSKMQNIMQLGAAGNQKITQGLSGLASTGAAYAGAKQMDSYIKALTGASGTTPTTTPTPTGSGVAGAASAAAPIINDVMKLKIQTPALTPSFGGTPSAFFPPAPTPKIGMPQAQAPAPSAAIGGGITVPAFNPSFGGTPSPYVTSNPIMQMPVIGAPQPAVMPAQGAVVNPLVPNSISNTYGVPEYQKLIEDPSTSFFGKEMPGPAPMPYAPNSIAKTYGIPDYQRILDDSYTPDVKEKAPIENMLFTPSKIFRGYGTPSYNQYNVEESQYSNPTSSVPLPNFNFNF